MKIRNLSPEDCRHLFETAAVLTRCGRLDEAMTIYDYLLVQDPSIPQYWTAGGIVRMKKGLLDEACVQFQVAESADENDPIPVMLRGLCLLSLGKRYEGIVALRRAQSSASFLPENRWIVEVIKKNLECRMESLRIGRGESEG